MINAASQRVSAPIPFPAKTKSLGLDVVSFLAATGLAIYLFTANTGRWGSRLVFALVGGLVGGLVIRAAAPVLMTTLFQFRHLVSDQRQPLAQRTFRGFLIGALLGCFLWDFSDGLLGGMQVAALLAVIGGVVGAISLGQETKTQTATELAPPVLAAICLTLALANAPLILVTAENDGSWSTVLDHAHLQGWQFGKEIIFTYGPLGFLTTPWFSAHAAALRLTTNVALTFSVAAGVCLLAWRLPVIWRWVTIAAFMLFNIHRNPAPHATFDVLMSQGLLCWGLLCLLESPPRPWGCALIFTGLAVFGALSKTTFLMLSLFSISAVAGCLTLQGNHKLGLGVIVCFIVGFLCFWMALGQRLSNIGDFLTSALAVAGPYDQTMCFPTPIPAQWWGRLTAGSSLAATLLASLVFLRQGGNSRWFQYLPTSWLAIVMFVAWKNGFARGDSYHVEAFVGFAVLLALVTSSLAAEPGIRTTCARCFAIITCFAGINTLKQSFFPGYIGGSLEHPWSLLYENVNVLSRPTQYWQTMTRAGEPVRRGAQLMQLKSVIGQASVDVFGNQQAVALLNDLNYRPRPIFSSYAAYSRTLMNLNEGFYLSAQAPEYVLFKLDALSGRFPPLEDAPLLRDVLVNYVPVATEHGLLLLKKARTDHPGLTLLREGTAKPKERIPLSGYGDTDLWVEIEVTPTIAGQIRRLLYNGSGVNIRVWRSGSEADSATFTAPTPMLAAGFVASPLLLNTMDVADLYSGTRIDRPIAYSVELAAGSQRLWRQTIRYHVYGITNRVGTHVSSDAKSTK